MIHQQKSSAIARWAGRGVALLCAGAIAAGAQSVQAASDNAADFYRGKQLSVYIGYGPGGGYDVYSRFMTRHYGAYVPGNPNVVPQNRPGAGSIRLANELYNTLPADGTVIGMIADVLPIKQVVGEPGIKFDARNFQWIGRLAVTDPVLVIRADSPALTIDDIRQREISIGVPGAGSATGQTISVINYLLGTKFKLISGYPSGNDVRMALERGEVHGSGSIMWGISKDWIKRNNLHVLYQTSMEKYADLPEAPRLIDLARNDDERRLLRFFGSYVEVGRSFIAPPKTPAERVEVLRAAFMKMARDPVFIAEAKKAKLDLNVQPGDELQRSIAEISNLQGDLLKKAIEISRATAAKEGGD
jgi:tripartite-type tricarboxylate transporter receptor subunit TctC